VIILSAASVDDAMCWILLALVIALIGSQAPIISLYIFLSTFAFVVFMFVVVSPLLLKFQRHFDQLNEVSNSEGVPPISQPMVVTAFLLTLLTSFITNSIGIHTMYFKFIMLKIWRVYYGAHLATRKWICGSFDA
jgi:Kef-type K+ transport system membrane component KefB